MANIHRNLSSGTLGRMSERCPGKHNQTSLETFRHSKDNSRDDVRDCIPGRIFGRILVEMSGRISKKGSR